LTDLLDGVELGSLERLPTPQRRALEVALLRVEPRGEAPSSRAIALGVLNVVLPRRRGDATDLERTSSVPGERIDVGPLRLGAIRVLVSEPRLEPPAACPAPARRLDLG